MVFTHFTKISPIAYIYNADHQKKFEKKLKKSQIFQAWRQAQPPLKPPLSIIYNNFSKFHQLPTFTMQITKKVWKKTQKIKNFQACRQAQPPPRPPFKYHIQQFQKNQIFRHEAGAAGTTLTTSRARPTPAPPKHQIQQKWTITMENCL